jgi:hypothetical protein
MTPTFSACGFIRLRNVATLIGGCLGPQIDWARQRWGPSITLPPNTSPRFSGASRVQADGGTTMAFGPGKNSV